MLCSLGAAPLAHADDDALSELAAIRDFRSRWPRTAALAHLKDAALVKLDPTFGVSPDGRRLLMIVFHEAASPSYSRTTCDGEWMVLGVEGPTGKAWCAPLDMGHRYQMPLRWNADGTRAIATAITNTRLVVALIDLRAHSVRATMCAEQPVASPSFSRIVCRDPCPKDCGVLEDDPHPCGDSIVVDSPEWYWGSCRRDTATISAMSWADDSTLVLCTLPPGRRPPVEVRVDFRASRRPRVTRRVGCSAPGGGT